MLQVDICNDRGERWIYGCTPLLFIEFLVEADDAVGDSEFQTCDEFSVGIL